MSVEIARLETVFTGNTRDADSAFDRVERRAESHVNKVNKTLGSLKSLSSFAAGLGLGAAIGSLKDGSSAILEYSANLEQTKIAFTTLMKSSDEAEAHLRELEKFAAETPFEFPELTQASRRFQNMGLSAKQVIPLLKAVGDAVAAAGGGSEQIDRVSVALSQIIAKNRTQNEELLQLSENGIAAYEILSKALGKSKAEVIKLASEGKISSDVFIQAFKQFSQQNFGDAMEKQSKTFSGAMSTIKDSLLQTSNTAFEPLYKEISEITVRIAEQSKNTDFSGVISAIIENISRGITIGAVGLGKAWVNSFIEGIKSGDIESIINALFFGSGTVLKSIGRGIAEEIVGAIENNVTGDLRLNLGVNAKGFSKEMLDSINALDKAKIDTGNFEKAKEVLGSVIDKLRTFGDDSQVTATKQALLKAGITDTNSALAAQALQYASLLDWQKKYAENLEFQANIDKAVADRNATNSRSIEKYKDSIVETLDAFDDPSRLGAFNRFLKGFDLSQISISKERLADFKATIANIDKGFEERGFAKKYKDNLDNLTSSFDQFNNNLTRQLRSQETEWTKLFDTLQDMTQGKINLSFIKQAIPKEGKEAIDLITASLDGLKLSAERVGGGASDLDKFVAKIVELIFKTDELRKKNAELANQNAFKSLSEQLNAELTKDAVVTAKARLEKTLLSEQYKVLTEAQKAYLMGLAAEIDAQEAYSRTFGGKFAAFKNSVPEIGDALEDSFLNSLDSISSALGRNLTDWRQGFGGMFKGVLLDFADLARQIAAEMLKLLVIKGLMSIFGNMFGGLLGGVSGGGASSGIPSFFPSGGVPAFASGGRPSAGDWAVVGEEGAELVRFGNDATVFSHDDSLALLGAGGGSSINNSRTQNDNRTYNLYVTMPSQGNQSKLPAPSDRQLMDRLASSIFDKARKH